MSEFRYNPFVRAALLFLLILSMTAASSNAQEPRKAPPSGEEAKTDPKATPADPKAVPADPKAVPVPTGGTPIHALMADMIFYREAKKAAFDVNLKTTPFSFEFPADSLEKGWTDELKKNAEEEINRPSGRGRTVTKLTFVQFTVSEDGKRVVGALVFFEGKEGATVLTDVATRLSFSSSVWTEAYSQDKCKNLRQKLHDTLGKPDRGETHERAILLIEDKMIKAKR